MVTLPPNILLFGQPGSGKTTTGLEILRQQSCYFQIDGDYMRKVTDNFDYTERGRNLNIQHCITFAKHLNYYGTAAVLCLVAPNVGLRNQLKLHLPGLESFCLQYDISNPRGREGFHSKDFMIEKTDRIIRTDKLSPTECALLIFKTIQNGITDHQTSLQHREQRDGGILESAL